MNEISRRGVAITAADVLPTAPSRFVQRQNAVTPEEQYRSAIEQDASGQIGSDIFGDETWFYPPEPKKLERVAMKVAGLQQRNREEQ